MNKSILATVSVFTLGIIVVIAGFFLLDVEKVTLNYWAFGSLLLSLVVSLFVMITLVIPKKNMDNMFYSAGISGAIGVYEILVIVSVVFTRVFKERENTFILLQIAIHALFFAAVIIITTTSGRVHNSSAKTQDNVKNKTYEKPKRGGF